MVAHSARTSTVCIRPSAGQTRCPQPAPRKESAAGAAQPSAAGPPGKRRSQAEGAGPSCALRGALRPEPAPPLKTRGAGNGSAVPPQHFRGCSRTAEDSRRSCCLWSAGVKGRLGGGPVGRRPVQTGWTRGIEPTSPLQARALQSEHGWTGLTRFSIPGQARTTLFPFLFLGKKITCRHFSVCCGNLPGCRVSSRDVQESNEPSSVLLGPNSCCRVICRRANQLTNVSLLF